MDVIDQEHAGHVFFEDGGRYFLRVECGTTAVYDLTVELTADELAAYRREGVSVVRELADQIRCWPDSFAHRQVSVG